MAKEALQLFLLFFFLSYVNSEINFTYNGFHDSNLYLDGSATVRSNGLLRLTTDVSKLMGHAFYPTPIRFKGRDPKNESSVITFSTNFVFSMNPKYPDTGGHGLVFVLSSTKQPKNCLPNQYFGLPNDTSSSFTRIFGVEFDIVQNVDLQDINDNHVGIDIGSFISAFSKPAVYYLDNTTTNNVSVPLKSGKPFQAWIEYNSQEKMVNVTVAPLDVYRPYQPLFSFPLDLSLVLDEYMYVGFSASTGLLSASHNIMGWSFSIGGPAKDLDHSDLPLGKNVNVAHSKGFALGLTFASFTLVFLIIFGGVHVMRRIKDGDEILEDWEVEYGARRFKYSELKAATRGFGEMNFIGSGGFGKVYKGVVPSTGLEVAIKRIAQDSQQGMREFVAEITSMGRLRHRNLLQLHGWCRRQDDLFLVYDYVPNGSLDTLLFDDFHQRRKVLTWEQRYKILLGVAQALLYLHEECEHRVIHRDIKPSNVLIDADLNAKLGDFGLARTYEHGLHSKTTHIVGTLGYLAPEFTRTGKATTSTDVYSYGALVLEVISGRRAIEPQRNANELVLVDWVRELHCRGEIIQAVDPTLEDYNSYEAELVLVLGLLCSHHEPDCRPTMRRVVEAMLGDAILPPDINCDGARSIIHYTDTSIDDDSSDPSYERAASSTSTSFTGFNKVVSGAKAHRITF